MAKIKLNISHMQLDTSRSNAPLRRREAEDINTSAARLAELMCDSNLNVRKTASQNSAAIESIKRDIQKLGCNEDLTCITHPDLSLDSTSIQTLIALGPWARQLAAMHPNTDVKTLHQLAKDPDAAVRRALAKHPAITSQTLLMLRLDDQIKVREMADQHPNLDDRDKLIIQRAELRDPLLSTDDLLSLHNDNSIYCLTLIAAHPSLQLEHIPAYLNHPDWRVRKALLDNPNITAAMIESLTHSLPFDLWTPLADHPNTPAHLLEKLSDTADIGLRCQLSEHPNASATLLKTLMEDGAFRVRTVAMNHPNAPQDHLALLIKAGASPDLLTQQHGDPELDSETLSNLCNGGHFAQQLVANHPNTDTASLTRLIADNHFMIREAVAKHTNRPQDLMRLLTGAGSSADLQDYQKPDPTLTIEQMQTLFEIGPWGRRLLSRHPALTVEFMKMLVDDTDWQIRRTLAKLEITPDDLLQKLCTDESAEVRWSLLKRDHPPRVVLEALAMDELPQIRLTVANHPNVPIDILETLKHDLDEDIRATISERLS